MAVRGFNGTSDRIVFSPGSLSFNGAYTVMMLVYPLSLAPAADKAYWGAPNATPALVEGMFMQTAGPSTMDLGSDFTGDATLSNSTLGVTANAWQWIGVSKASGTVAPVFHRSVYGSGTWTHAASGFTKADNTNAPTALVIGDFLVAGANPFDMRIATWGFWTRQVANTDIEALNNSFNDYINMNGGGPAALMKFNQATTSDPVQDVIGTADQSSINGTTVVTGSDPAGFNFADASTGEVSYLGAGAAATATSGNVTPAYPGSLQADDVLVCEVTSYDNVSVSFGGSGWTKKHETNNGSNLRQTIAWKRRASGDSDTNVVITHTGGDRIIARVHALRNAKRTGDPFESSSVNTPAAAASGTFPNVTTTLPLDLLLYGLSYGNDFSTGPSISNAQGLTITERDETGVA